MRSVLMVAVLLAWVVPAGAQEFVVSDVREEFVVSEPGGEAMTIDGIVRQIFDERKPWQLVNPAAPAEYGTGEENVSEDEAGGTPVRARGLVVFGFEW